MPTDEELMEIARKQAKDKAGFYVHFGCYVVVNVGLFIMWTVFFKITDITGLFPIVFGPLFGLGIGIVAHFISVFAGVSEQRVQKEFKKLKEQTK